MSTKYTVIARRKPGDPTAPEKYYPSVKSSGRITLRQLSKQIAEISTVSSVDTLAVLEALLTLIPREISNGNIVNLGDFGTFRLRIQRRRVRHPGKKLPPTTSSGCCPCSAPA